jgi:hypothetical protein
LINLRNDFSVWGERETLSGAKVPIHYRYAIDKKPDRYVSIAIDETAAADFNNKYPTLEPLTPYKSCIYINKDIQNQEENSNNTFFVDWQELLYQMARDY